MYDGLRRASSGEGATPMHGGRAFSVTWLALLCAFVAIPNGHGEQLITFLHWNDHHARVEPGGNDGGTCLGTFTTPQDLSMCFGGYARMSTLYNQTLANQSAEDVILLNAGDTFVGTTWDQIYRGNASRLFLQALNSNNALTMALGNHEFDYGPEYLGVWSTQLGFDLICSNLIVKSQSPELLTLRNNVKNFTTFRTSDGVTIGVVGWITPQTKDISLVGPGIEFGDILVYAQAAINQVRAQGVTRVIGLSHAGYESDLISARFLLGIDIIIGGHSHTLLANKPYPVTIKNDRQKVPKKWKYKHLFDEIEAEVEEKVEKKVDHIAGKFAGLVHKAKGVWSKGKEMGGDDDDGDDDGVDSKKWKLNSEKAEKYEYILFNVTDKDQVEGPYPTWVDSEFTDGKRVAVVQAYQFSKYVGKLYTYWEGGNLVRLGGEPVLLGGLASGNPVPVDPFFQARINELAVPVRDYQTYILGTTATPLVGERNIIRGQETNLGNAVCAAVLKHGVDFGLQRVTFDPLSPISICLYNSGGIYASIPGPDVTVDNVYTALPFGNVISILNVTGQGLLAALENGVSAVKVNSGRFLQVAGIRFGWNPAAPPGSRVVNVFVFHYDLGFQPLNTGMQYAVLTNNFVASGNDGFAMLNQATSKGLSTTYYKFSIPTSEAFIILFNKTGTLNFTTDGRITNCATQQDDALCGPPPSCKQVMGITLDKPHGCKAGGSSDSDDDDKMIDQTKLWNWSRSDSGKSWDDHDEDTGSKKAGKWGSFDLMRLLAPKDPFEAKGGPLHFPHGKLPSYNWSMLQEEWRPLAWHGHRGASNFVQQEANIPGLQRVADATPTPPEAIGIQPSAGILLDGEASPQELQQLAEDLHEDGGDDSRSSSPATSSPLGLDAGLPAGSTMAMPSAEQVSGAGLIPEVATRPAVAGGITEPEVQPQPPTPPVAVILPQVPMQPATSTPAAAAVLPQAPELLTATTPTVAAILPQPQIPAKASTPPVAAVMPQAPVLPTASTPPVGPILPQAPIPATASTPAVAAIMPNAPMLPTASTPAVVAVLPQSPMLATVSGPAVGAETAQTPNPPATSTPAVAAVLPQGPILPTASTPTVIAGAGDDTASTALFRPAPAVDAATTQAPVQPATPTPVVGAAAPQAPVQPAPSTTAVSTGVVQPSNEQASPTTAVAPSLPQASTTPVSAGDAAAQGQPSVLPSTAASWRTSAEEHKDSASPMLVATDVPVQALKAPPARTLTPGAVFAKMQKGIASASLAPVDVQAQDQPTKPLFTPDGQILFEETRRGPSAAAVGAADMSAQAQLNAAPFTAGASG